MTVLLMDVAPCICNPAYSSEGREFEPTCGLHTDWELPRSCLVEQCAVAQMGALNTIRTSLAGPSLIPRRGYPG